MNELQIRDAANHEFKALGQLMVDVYSGLEGFVQPAEQPQYYEMLANIGQFALKKDARVLVALSPRDELVGGVVYFGDMSQYGSGGAATRERHAAGIRLLAVDPRFRGSGAGKALTQACIEIAREQGHANVVLHTTRAMQRAWSMYEKLGFMRATDLDFMQGQVEVFGFRLRLNEG